MKINLLRTLLIISVIYTLASCSSDDSTSSAETVSSLKVVEYTYNATELQTMDLINNYRVSIGLNPLAKINHISYKSEEHNNYMIANNVVNHNDFVARSQNIIEVLGATKVSENIAYNYNSPNTVFEAWMKSPKHKAIIIGGYTHFGISIRENPINGKKYYTNIFAKI